jgi:2-methylfumaryl-CoA isomerase
MSYGLLDGVRIIEGSAFIAAPLAGLTLAQLGADVIRFDAIGGGIDYGRLPVAPSGRSLYWTGLNKGKRSLAVDIRRPEGRQLVRDLVALPGPGAGILLTNLGPSWLSHASLTAARADLISMTIEGNPDGSTAVDYTVNCATGLPFVTGGGSAASPVNHVLPAWDVACALTAALSVASAVARRRQSGAGAEMRLALSDVAFATVAHLGHTAEAEILGSERPSLGNDLYGAFGRDFPTSDGRRVMVAAISQRQWASLVAACEMAEPIAALERAMDLDFTDEVDRFEGRDVIAGLVRRWCARRSLAEIRAVFEAKGVCWGLYQSFTQLVRDDPRFSETNPVFQRVTTEGVGTHMAAGFPARIAGVERAPVVPAPMLGAHTDEILADVLGLGEGAIGRLHDQGIVAGPAA